MWRTDFTVLHQSPRSEAYFLELLNMERTWWRARHIDEWVMSYAGGSVVARRGLRIGDCVLGLMAHAVVLSVALDPLVDVECSACSPLRPGVS